MLDRSDAERIMDHVLRVAEATVEGGLELVHELTVAKPYGWIFFYEGRRYLANPTLEHAIGGNGPVVVMAEDGEVVTLPTYLSPEEAIAAFERSRGLSA